MAGYTKLFSSILDSTVWQTPPHVRLVWITMLAMADGDGLVEASVPGLALRAGVDRSLCEQALAVLAAPDPDSRSKALDGRRIVEAAGGWELVNYATYRHRMSVEERRERDAERQRRARAAKASASAPRPSPSAMSQASRLSPKIQHAEAEAEAEAECERARAPDPGPDPIASAWRTGYVRRYEQTWALTSGGPAGKHMASLIAKAEAQKAPLAFVDAALEGFFADAWAKSKRHPIGNLAEHAERYAAAKPAPAEALTPEEAYRITKAEVDANNREWDRKAGITR